MSSSDIVWIPKKDYLLCSDDGNLKRCVACEEPLEYNKETFCCQHKCNPKKIQKKDTLRKNGVEACYNRSRGHGLTYADRLKHGFRKLTNE